MSHELKLRWFGVAPLTETVIDDLLKDTKLQIKYRGVGHGGYDTSVIKSALQKGVRRNEHQLVGWALRETIIYFGVGNRFPELVTAAKAFNTNVINRLYIIAVEDCSPRSLFNTNKCAKYLEIYSRDGDSHPQSLVFAGAYLSVCPSSRVCSHLRYLCGGGGRVYDCYRNEEEREKKRLSATDRFRIISNLLCHHQIDCRKEDKYREKLNQIRLLAAYHTMKAYREISGMDDYGNFLIGDDQEKKKHLTGADKKKKFSPFWTVCTDATERIKNYALENRNQSYFDHFYEKVVYAVYWRKKFFESKHYFPEESLFLLSAIELLIAVIHGPSDELVEIQMSALLLIGGVIPNEGEGFARFNWLRDHEPISQMPRYVMDQHTSRPTSSFALQGSRVVNGDAKWTPEEWLSEYTSDRLKRERTMKRKYISENETPIDEKKKKRMKKNDHDVVKFLNALRFVEKSEFDSVIRKFNERLSVSRKFFAKDSTPSTNQLIITPRVSNQNRRVFYTSHHPPS